MRKFSQFIKNNYLWLILAAYGLFSIFYKWSGSFMGDEATYSQVAKESLFNHSFFVLHWKSQLWFEKPPLVIWATALAFKIFGISETSAHIFPGLSWIASAVILYSLGKEMFRSKLAGFFSGYVFMTVPLISLYSRVNMMDIPVGTAIALCSLALWMIFHGKEKWWLVFGLSLGLGVLTKSVVGLFPVAMAAWMAIAYKRTSFFQSKFFAYSVLLFISIALPWHLFMTIKFGSGFWQDYIGFHIWDRFSEQILPFPWENNSRWGYVKLLFQRSGIWIWIFSFSTLGILYSLLPERFGKSDASHKNREGGALWRIWFLEHGEIWFFLFSWSAIVFLPFFLSVTKLPNYMVLAFYPFSLLVGGCLSYALEKADRKILLAICLLSVTNFLTSTRMLISDFGEAHVFLPKILIRFGHLQEHGLAVVMWPFVFSLIIIFFASGLKIKKLRIIAISVLLAMNTLVHFNPSRNEFLKTLGNDISGYSKNTPVNLFFLVRPDQYSFHCVGAFYLPLGSVIEPIGQRKAIIMSDTEKYPSLCFVEKNYLNEEITRGAVFSYAEGKVIKCRMEN